MNTNRILYFLVMVDISVNCFGRGSSSVFYFIYLFIYF